MAGGPCQGHGAPEYLLSVWTHGYPHIVPALGHFKLKNLTPANVRTFYRQRLNDGLAPATVHKMHVVLHKALDEAVSDGLVPRNSAKGVKVPQTKK